ncbi:MAG: tetratricopeptide repeat protein, partial [Exilispira sp.]
DSIIKGSLYPFADFLKKYFMQDTAKSEKQNKENFEKIYDKLLNKLSSIINKDAEGLIKELNRTKSFIAALIGIYYEKSPYQTIDPKGRYENTLYALKDFFIANSLLKPTIIILEDLQWLDYDSMEEFKILTRNIKNYKIGLILTGRFFDDGSKPLLKIDDDIEKDEIYLENLSTLSSEKLIDIQLTDRADEKLKSFIFSKTLGNPFYIEQFCQYLIENNLIIRTEQGYKLIDKNIDIPSSINLIIMARIDRLSQELKEAVQIASVIGVEFELQILDRLINEVMKNSIEDNNEIVYECEKQKIWISLSEIKYIFKHALLQQVAYEMQLKQRLIFVHNLTGKIMEELFKDNPQKYIEIAYHYDKAENIEKAIFYFHKAAEFCKANYNNNETIKCYDKLLTLVKNEEKIIEILNNKGLVLELMGDWDNSEKCYREAMQISLKLNNQYLICKSKELAASLLISKGSYDSAMDLLIEAEAIAKEIGDERQYSFILKDFGNIYSNQGEYDKALEYFERMKDVCLKIDDKIGYSIALENIGNVFSDKGHYEKAMKYYDEKKNICLQINDKRGYSVAIGNLGLCYHYKGELDKALECYEERKKICFEIGDRTGYAIAVGNIGNIYKDKFDLENALKCFEEIKEIFLSMGDKRRYSIAIGNIGSLFLSKGDFENAINNFELQKEICLLLDNKRGYITAISMLGQSFYFMEDYDNALKYLDEAIELAKSLNLDYHLSDLLRKKAELLYEINEIEKAKTINENSYEISKIIEAKDQIFEYNVLKYKIEKDKDRLLSLLEKTDEDEEIALIYYTLFKIIDDELDKMKYKKMAIQLYENLFHKTGFYYYKKQLKDLKN